jgi:hypothetical protein
MPNHVGVKMAAPAGIDLNRWNTSLTNPIGIIRSCLIALDNPQGLGARKHIQSLNKKSCLTRTRARYQIQGKLAMVC